MKILEQSSLIYLDMQTCLKMRWLYVYREIPKYSVIRLLQMISEFTKFAQYKLM